MYRQWKNIKKNIRKMKNLSIFVMFLYTISANMPSCLSSFTCLDIRLHTPSLTKNSPKRETHSLSPKNHKLERVSESVCEIMCVREKKDRQHAEFRIICLVICTRVYLSPWADVRNPSKLTEIEIWYCNFVYGFYFIFFRRYSLYYPFLCH